MTGSLRDSIQEISPPWLATGTAEKYLYSAAAILDAFVDVMNQGARARMPGLGTPTALVLIGADRDIDRGPSETDDAFALRLVRAFDTWRIAGSPRALLEQLQIYFGTSPPPIRCVNNNSLWHEIDASTGVITKLLQATKNWIWDTNAPPLNVVNPHWWREWVIIDSSSGPWSQWFIGDPGVSVGDGHTIGSTATVDEVSTIQRIVKKWKPAHAFVPNIIVTFDSSLFERTDTSPPNPNGNYDDPANRDTTAAYWYGATT